MTCRPILLPPAIFPSSCRCLALGHPLSLLGRFYRGLRRLPHRLHNMWGRFPLYTQPFSLLYCSSRKQVPIFSKKNWLAESRRSWKEPGLHSRFRAHRSTLRRCQRSRPRSLSLLLRRNQKDEVRGMKHPHLREYGAAMQRGMQAQGRPHLLRFDLDLPRLGLLPFRQPQLQDPAVHSRFDFFHVYGCRKSE